MQTCRQKQTDTLVGTHDCARPRGRAHACVCVCVCVQPRSKSTHIRVCVLPRRIYQRPCYWIPSRNTPLLLPATISCLKAIPPLSRGFANKVPEWEFIDILSRMFYLCSWSKQRHLRRVVRTLKQSMCDDELEVGTSKVILSHVLLMALDGASHPDVDVM